jgi:hypothetical protein
MSKRWRYIISAILSAIGFYLFLSLPVDSRYYGLALELVLVVFCFWFGLGIIFDKYIDTQIMSVLLPGLLTLGMGLFVAILPDIILISLVSSVLFGVILYFLFLAENVFMVAIGYKTVPLYRSAYTVSLIVALLTAFFLFDSVLSFRFPFWLNLLLVGGLTIVLFLYQFWAIAIDLPDDGKNKGRWVYVLGSGIFLSELAVIFSFWPVGIFRGSVYLVSAIYILLGFFQADIRGRLFSVTGWSYSLVGGAMVLAIILLNNWG